MIATEFHTARPAIPGLRFRHFAGPEDYPGMAGANMAARLDAGGDAVVTAETVANTYDHLPNAELDRDVLIVEINGRIAGYARVEWRDQTDGSRSYEVICLLEPDVRGRGIGSAMLAWGEARAREIADAHLGECPRWLAAKIWDADERAARLLRRNGYEPVRRSFDMVRPHLDDIPTADLPEGFEVRPVDRTWLRDIFVADAKAFRDHWGSIEEDEADFDRFEQDHRTDPSLFVVAFAGDEIAGAVLNVIDDTENAMFDRSRGTLDSVFVRRPYRRRGLARALVARSLALLRARGMTGAALSVDADNPNAALRLYESCGFAPVRSMTSWRKPLEGATETSR
jgi:mycothiol synthase